MHTSRRDFLKSSALTLAGTTLLSSRLFALNQRNLNLGIQLYSIRDEMKKDPLGTLRQVAAIGYKNVEHANYVDRKFYGYSVPEFKKILNELGFSMPSGHTVMRKDHWNESTKDFTDAWKMTVEDAAALGQKYVISPWLDESLRKNFDDMKRYMEVFNKSGELCKKSGMKFGYHNHDFEFSVKLNNVKVYDIILQNTDPALVAQQLDIGNMYSGGGRAMEVLKQYPGRFELLHVKDEIKTAAEKYESTVIGKGLIQVKQVIDEAKKTGGTSHFIIEQESYQGQPPIEAVKQDYKIMKSWGY
ncbi:MAG: sugar phosphate isomerase/epimerase [Chitinophagaceae bacterium]